MQPHDYVANIELTSTSILYSQYLVNLQIHSNYTIQLTLTLVRPAPQKLHQQFLWHIFSFFFFIFFVFYWEFEIGKML